MAGSTTRYVLDVNRQLTNVLAETDSSGAVVARYVYGLGLAARILPDGSAQYYHYDSRGSTIALTDVTATTTDRYAYDAFGRGVNRTGTTANAFGYLGRHGVRDEGNGLAYARARYYEPGVGRFLTKDPSMGSASNGQSLHRYIYAFNNPIVLVDIGGFSPTEGSGLNSQSGTSDQNTLHQLLVGDSIEHKLLLEQALQRGAQAQATLYYAQAWVTILEATNDAIGGLGSVFTGDILGAGASVLSLTASLERQYGHETTAQWLGVGANALKIADAALAVKNAVQSASTLLPAIENTGINFSNVGRIEVDVLQFNLHPLERTISAGGLYQGLVGPTVKGAGELLGSFVSPFF